MYREIKIKRREREVVVEKVPKKCPLSKDMKLNLLQILLPAPIKLNVSVSFIRLIC